MEHYLHDGIRFDLSIPYADVMGVEWVFTGRTDERGEPLMASRQRGETYPHKPYLSLPDLYATHGPLIPLPRRPDTDLIRRVLTAVTA
jgi:hypothetical protein